ncbi:Palmitoyltransferase [Balamuthia mandrillaris]
MEKKSGGSGTSFQGSSHDLNLWSEMDLRLLLEAMGVDHEDCREKRDLVLRVQDAFLQQKAFSNDMIDPDEEEEEEREVHPESKGFTALHEAVSDGEAAAVVQLLQSGGIDVNARNDAGETPLHCALCHNIVNCIKPLIQHGANPNLETTERSGCTPIYLGYLRRNQRSLRRLLEACREEGVAIDWSVANRYKETVLHFAACHGDLPYVRLFVQFGADVNIKGYLDVTPLKMAEKYGHDQVAAYLRSCGAVVFPRQLSPSERPRTLPNFVGDGYHQDERMLQHERDFGGALWADQLEVWYDERNDGPKVGLCVQIKLILNRKLNMTPSARTKHMASFTWLWGFISEVPNERMVVCTVRLNVDHDGCAELQGEWQATLEEDLNKQFPWVLTKLVRLPEEDKATKGWDALMAAAREREIREGRQVPRKDSGKHVMLKGVAADDHEGGKVRIITKIVLKQEEGKLRLYYHFEDGDVQVIKGSKVLPIFKMVCQQKEDLGSTVEIINEAM